MFARVMVVGEARLAEASAEFRIIAALRHMGHAVRLCHATDLDVIASCARGFQPTLCLILADGVPCSHDIAEKINAVVAEVGENGALSAMRDSRYADAITSDCFAGRTYQVAFCQELDAERIGLLSQLKGDGVRFAPNPDSASFPYIFRNAEIAVLFDGEDAPSPFDIALRASEGCVVLVERSLLDRYADGSLERSVLSFERQELASLITGMLGNGASMRAALAAQRSWIKSLPVIEDVLAGVLSRADGDAGNALSVDCPAKNIVVYGWLGMENFGDDLLLQVVADRVRERFPESVIQVIAGNAQRVEELCGFEAVVAGDYAGMRRLISQADALIFCGGLIFDDPMSTTAGEIELFMEPFINPACQAAACLMAWQHGVPAFYLGAGLGPVAKPATREALRYIGLAGARLLLRDQDSVDLALKSGVPSAQVGAYADLVLSAHDTVVERASDELPDGLLPDRYITVALRDWPLNPAGFEEALAAELDRISEQTGLAVAFVPFDPDDVHIHHRVAERMQAKTVVEIASRLAMPEMLSVVKHSAMAVAMRLHCSILHHVLGKPAIGLDYNEKVGSHFREMGRGAYLIPLDSVAGSLSTAALRASADPEVTRSQIEEGLASLTLKVEEAFQELFSAIDGHVPAPRETEVFYPRARSQVAVDLEASRAREQALSARVTQLQGELDAARARISDLEQSTSYRLGHALVKVPHALFRGR